MTKLGMLALCAGLTSCVHGEGQGNITPVSMGVLLEKLRCELIESRHDFQFLKEPGWSVAANMTLKSKRTARIGGSVSGLDHISAGGSFALGLPFSGGGSTERSFTGNYAIDIGLLADQDCATYTPAVPLQGNIGVRELVAEQQKVMTVLNRLPTRDTQIAAVEKNSDGVFSAKVEFAVDYGMSDAGPVWTLTHFIGKGLLSGSKTDTGTLEIAFANRPPPPPPRKPAKSEGKATWSAPVAGSKAVERAPATVTAPPTATNMPIKRNAPGFDLLLYNKSLQEK